MPTENDSIVSLSWYSPHGRPCKVSGNVGAVGEWIWYYIDVSRLDIVAAKAAVEEAAKAITACAAAEVNDK